MCMYHGGTVSWAQAISSTPSRLYMECTWSIHGLSSLYRLMSVINDPRID